MASSIIHIAVAKEINKVLKRDESKLLLGSVAPDLSKLIGETKLYSHFLEKVGNNVPNMERFLEEYKNNLNDDFVLGYFIHLYTDYFWFKFFIPEILDSKQQKIKKLNGDSVNLSGEMLIMYIYNDYTNLNLELIKKYNIDLEFLYDEDNQNIKSIIKEIPYDKLEVLSNKIVEIVEKSHSYKYLVFNLENIEKFIKTSVELILGEIENLK